MSVYGYICVVRHAGNVYWTLSQSFPAFSAPWLGSLPAEHWPNIQCSLTTSPHTTRLASHFSVAVVTFSHNHSVMHNVPVQLAWIPWCVLPLPKMPRHLMTKRHSYAGRENVIGPAAQLKQMSKGQNGCACDYSRTGLGVLPCAAQTETLYTYILQLKSTLHLHICYTEWIHLTQDCPHDDYN